MVNCLEKLGEQKVFKALNPIFVVKAESGGLICKKPQKK